MKILLAYDGGEPAHKALDLTAEFAKKFDAKLERLSAIPVPPGRTTLTIFFGFSVEDVNASCMISSSDRSPRSAVGFRTGPSLILMTFSVTVPCSVQAHRP